MVASRATAELGIEPTSSWRFFFTFAEELSSAEEKGKQTLTHTHTREEKNAHTQKRAEEIKATIENISKKFLNS